MPLFPLVVLAGLLLFSGWRRSRADQRAWQEAQWDCEDGDALRQFAAMRARDERRAQWAAPLPWHAFWLLAVFLSLCAWMLVDTWGTPRLWFSLPTSSIFVMLLASGVWRVWYRRRWLKATAPDAPTAPAADVQARRSLTPAVPRH